MLLPCLKDGPGPYYGHIRAIGPNMAVWPRSCCEKSVKEQKKKKKTEKSHRITFAWFVTCCCESPVLSRLNLLKSENFIFSFGWSLFQESQITFYCLQLSRCSPFSGSLTCHMKTPTVTSGGLVLLTAAPPCPHSEKAPRAPFPFSTHSQGNQLDPFDPFERCSADATGCWT